MKKLKLYEKVHIYIKLIIFNIYVRSTYITHKATCL